MRADTASITTPAKPERDFAVTTAIVPVTTAIAQSKKNENTFGNRKNVAKNENTFGNRKKRRKKMKIRLGIENVEKKRKKNEKKRKENEKKTKRKTKKTRFLTILDF